MLRRFSALAVLLLVTPLLWNTRSSFAAPADDKKDVVLKSSDMTPKLFPETVFFRGQSAPVQMRNTGGVHFADDAYMLAGMVDNSGYSSGLRQKYQAYLLTEVPLQIGDQTVKPGAYGFGFLEGTMGLIVFRNDCGMFTVGKDGAGVFKLQIDQALLVNPAFLIERFDQSFALSVVLLPAFQSRSKSVPCFGEFARRLGIGIARCVQNRGFECFFTAQIPFWNRTHIVQCFNQLRR